MKSYKAKIKKSIKPVYFAFFIVIFIFSFLIFNSVRSSLFFQNKERVNLVFYGQYPRYYSLGLSDDTNFSINFFPDLTVMIPGGYGFYRIGALGKLVNLEKKTNLFKTTFSLNTASFVDYYFYPQNDNIFFGGSRKIDQNLPGFKDIFFLDSNANILDKLYLYLYFLGKKTDDFKPIELNPETKSGLTMLNYDTFFKTHQGFFYTHVFRSERKSVQIKYNLNYQTAFSISELIQGEGIRVVDITEDEKINKKCNVIEDSQRLSETARELAYFFGCDVKLGQVEKSDIILELGDREREWEIN